MSPTNFFLSCFVRCSPSRRSCILGWVLTPGSAKESEVKPNSGDFFVLATVDLGTGRRCVLGMEKGGKSTGKRRGKYSSIIKKIPDEESLFLCFFVLLWRLLCQWLLQSFCHNEGSQPKNKVTHWLWPRRNSWVLKLAYPWAPCKVTQSVSLLFKPLWVWFL